MIELIYHNGSVMVYKVKDWELLRKEYRIIGECISCTQYVPVLPLRLLTEEAVLLLNKGLAKIVRYSASIDEKNRMNKYRTLQETLLEEEKEIYKNLRLQQVKSMMDKIIEGKRKRGDVRSDEEILNDEVDKAANSLNFDTMIWPINLTTDLEEVNKETISEEEIMKDSNILKYQVFCDLWEKGFYITTGSKFGGDFLVYKGDPLVYHAIYIVHCINEQDIIQPRQVVAFGRLGTSVKKKPLLATLQNNKVKYITINWMES